MADDNWRPGASGEFLAYRAGTYRQIRNFFHARNVLEVSTPLLGASSVTDLHIESLTVSASKRLLYLQTSPEFYMKRLLAAGSGPIYQICQAFRQGDAGRLHNLEFSLLEWYRPGFSLDQLMDEVEALINVLIAGDSFERYTYRELFEKRFDCNPHRLDTSELLNLCRTSTRVDTAHVQVVIDPGTLEHSIDNHSTDNHSTDSHGTDNRSALNRRTLNRRTLNRRTKENCLDLLFAEEIQPALQSPTFVVNYPASQASLAETVQAEGDEIALRFELFWRGVELANGYFELRDAAVLESRMESDNRDRTLLDKVPVPCDRKLLQAMISGLPECSGVALGLDRLLMLLTQSTSLDQVIAFTSERL